MKKIPHNNNSEFLKKKLFKIEKQFLNDIQARIETFFDALKGVLFVYEQNSESDYKQSLNYVALNKVIVNSLQVNQKFNTSIQSAFKYFLQGEYNFFINENLHIGNFQKKSVQDKESEYEIVTSLISKIEDNSEKQLLLFGDFYSACAANKKLSLNQLPISPYVIMNSILASIEGMDLNASVRMIVYNVFDINVLLKLNAIYVNLIEKYNLKKINPMSVVHENNKPKTIDAKYVIIEKILNRKHTLKKCEVDEKPLISQDLILQSINILQEKLIKKNKIDPTFYLDPNKTLRLLKVSIGKLDNNSTFMKYSKSDQNRLQLLQLFFKYIESDVSIRGLLKSILLRLQLPVFKVALKDSGIFKNSSDPLRNLLNQMSYVPIGFSDELNQSHKYIIKLNETVDLITKQTSYHQDFFQRQFDDLNVFIAKMYKKFNLIQKRIKEKEVGLEKITQTKHKVAEILEQKMHKKHMPVFIRDLFLGVWKNVLVLEFLRHPENSRACQSKVAFIDTILTHINKDKIDASIIKELAIIYCEGLSLVAFNGKELKNKEIELVRFLTKKQNVQTKSTNNRDPNPFELILYKKNDSLIQSPTDEPHKTTDSYDDMVRSIKVGTWLEFTEDNKKIRAKVSWISPITNNFLLVNSNGIRMTDRSPTEIADGFRSDTCSELQTVPLFDRALLKIAKDLNESP